MKKFHLQNLGDSEMSTYNEEKKFYLPVDEKESSLNFLAHSPLTNSLSAWNEVSDRALRYAHEGGVNDEWFSRRLSGETHNALGLTLRVFDINIRRGWVNSSDDYRDHQWNRLLRKYNNALVRVILSLAIARGRGTIDELFYRGFSADSMCAVIKDALTLLFDAQVPDATTPAEMRAALRHPDRDNIYCGGAHACFSIAGDDTNVCWRSRTHYHDYLCHFFRTALYYALAFFRHYMTHQKYYVSENMEMKEFKVGEHYCCKVIIAFSIDVHPEDRKDSSDDEESESDHERHRERLLATGIPFAVCEIKEELRMQHEEEEVEHEEEEVEYEHDDNTFTITYDAEGTITTHHPLQFNRITQSVVEGRYVAESDQIEGLVEIMVRLLSLEQLGRTAQCVTLRIRHLTGQQHTVQPAVAENFNFFSTTSFSSDSEREEEM